MTTPTHNPRTPLWGVFETSLQSTVYYANPIQDSSLTVKFTSPSGRTTEVDGFWDGGRVWRIRFMPDEEGRWSFETYCSDASNTGLAGVTGEFDVIRTPGGTAFRQLGAVRCSASRRYFEHADGTPFFWLGDTAWNGALLASDTDWHHYLSARAAQKFNVIQWVATQWRGSPLGDEDGRQAYSGNDRIMVNPQFFQRLDRRVTAANAAGMLNAIVMLWAHPGRAYPETNPGYTLPEDQAVLLGRYMAARWGAFHVAWILGGDGDYSGEATGKWHRIGEGIFGGRSHAPVAMHFQGKKLPLDDFGDQEWLDVMAYQSGHYDDDESLRWIFDGPAARRWQEQPVKVLLNSEPCYEDHMAPSGRRFNAHDVRRACYWSLLSAPAPGITYGGHGIWGWDNGVDPASDHPRTGVPLKWSEALQLEAGSQMRYMRAAFESVRWNELVPAPEMVERQSDKAGEHVSAARTEDGATAIVYTPVKQSVALNLSGMAERLAAEWINPRSGEKTAQPVNAQSGHWDTSPPAEGDWLLTIRAG